MEPDFSIKSLSKGTHRRSSQKEFDKNSDGSPGIKMQSVSPIEISGFGGRASAGMTIRNKTASQFFDSSVIAYDELEIEPTRPNLE